MLHPSHNAMGQGHIHPTMQWVGVHPRGEYGEDEHGGSECAGANMGGAEVNMKG